MRGRRRPARRETKRMGSRIVPAGEAGPLEAVAWRTVSGAAGRGGVPAGGPEASPAELEALRVRLAEVEREAARREEAGRQSGYERGFDAGRREEAARVDAAVARLAATIEELASSRRRLRRQAEQDVLKLAVAIARRVLHRELQADPEAMLGLVKAALDGLDAREVEQVRVSPQDAPAVRAHLERLRPEFRFEVAPDTKLERGAAVFETRRGTLDASVDTQLQEIERGLADRIGR